MRLSLIPPALLACCLTGSALAQDTGATEEKPSAGVRITTPDNPSVPGVRTPIEQPHTFPPPAAATPATDQDADATSRATADAPPPTADAPPPERLDTEQIPGTTQDTRRRRTAEADNSPVTTPTADTQTAEEDLPPTLRGVGTSSTRPDCSQLRGIEKSECERRDSTRDDLPAGVTRTQPER